MTNYNRDMKYGSFFTAHLTGLGYGNCILCHTETPPLLPSPPRHVPPTTSPCLFAHLLFVLSLGYCYQKLSFCIYVTPRVHTATTSRSGSRTRDSGAGGGRSNKELQRLQPLASVARAPLFEVRRVRFYTQPLLA